MPTYNYHCTFCDTDQTINRKMSEYNPDEPCQICGEAMSRKVNDLVSNYKDAQGFYGKKSN